MMPARASRLDMTAVVSPRHNTARVLRLLWLYPGISRVEMAERLGLNRSTVTLVIQDLLERELVESVAFADASPTGGRKKVQLAIRARYGCVGGVQVHADYLRVALVDLGGRLVYEHLLPGAVTPRNLHRRLARAGEHLVQRARQVRLPLLGLGVGLPGIVDPERGVLLQSIPLGLLDEEAVAAPLAAHVGVPVLLDNDAHCCCWGELTCARDAAANFLFVLGEWRRSPHRPEAPLTSIGVGVVLGRAVHYGRGFSAGEFRSIAWRPGNTSQFSLSDDEIASARTDPALYRTLVRELARNAAMIVHVLNLDRLYLGGFFDGADVEIQAIFTEEIRRNWTYPTPPICEVVFSSRGELAVAYGAAGLVLERAFADPAVAERGAPGLALLVPGG